VYRVGAIAVTWAVGVGVVVDAEWPEGGWRLDRHGDSPCPTDSPFADSPCLLDPGAHAIHHRGD
jgi:hypothetical protein